MQNKPAKSVFASDPLALIAEYIVSGGNTTGSSAFELI